MPSNRSNEPLPVVAYLCILAIQVPVWLCCGLVWSALMVFLAGSPPVNALVGGLGWGLVMWVLVGNLMAFALVRRRFAEIPAPDRAAFRAAIERTCGKLRLAVLAESADAVVLGPKRALVRFRLQEVRVEFVGGTARLTAPALSFTAVRKELNRALAETAIGE
jgi:hypothetical protein